MKTFLRFILSWTFLPGMLLVFLLDYLVDYPEGIFKAWLSWATFDILGE